MLLTLIIGTVIITYFIERTNSPKERGSFKDRYEIKKNRRRFKK